MNPTFRTLVFVAVAVASAGTAWLTNWATQPAELKEFSLTGDAFYPKFTDPLKAVKLRVAAFDDRLQQPVEFEVQKAGGKWVIPSHHNYPTEAKERLAETAASLLGVTRNAVAGQTEADHERLGVVDPLDEESAADSGRGRRITLSDKSDEILVDLIIGNAIEGRQNEFYVRRPDEKETYHASLEVKLSTKFAEWIQPDLLKLDAGDLVALSVTEPSITIVNGRVIPVKAETSRIDRLTSSDPWTLAGLDEEQEELKEDEVREMVNALDDLKILGVRPKPPGMTANFTPSISDDPQKIREFLSSNGQLLADLQEQGFFLIQGENNQLNFGSRGGEVTASTDEGVVYHLHFGREFSGTIEEIEIGGGKDSDKDDSAGDKSSKNGKQSRYLFVRVDFKEPPVPVKPEKPEEPAKPQGSPDAEDGPKPKPENEANEQDPKEEQPAVAKKDGEPTAKEIADAAKAKYDEALQQYEKDLQQYESDLTEHANRVDDGKKTAKSLNHRFADWYYVISGENFEKLRLTRADLVKPKELLETETKPGEETDSDPKSDTNDDSPDSTPPTSDTSDDAKESDPKPDAAEKDGDNLPGSQTSDEKADQSDGGGDDSANKRTPSGTPVEKKP